MPVDSDSIIVQHSHLRHLLGEVHRMRAEAETLFDRLSETQFTWKPDPQTWSVLECFDHLISTGRAYHPRLRKAIAKARQKGQLGTSPYLPTWFGRRFIEALEPGTRKLKTMTVFQPASAPNDPTVPQRFLEMLDDFKAIIRETDGLNLNKLKFGSPVTPLIRFTIGEGLTMLTVHQKRHLAQAEAVTQYDAFPEQD